MDNLTHTAVGLFLARAGLNRWTPRATPILLLAANAPDVDVVSLAGGPLAYLHYHRFLTHSLAFVPLVAAASVGLVRLLWRTPLRWTGALAAAIIAVLSHLLLDLTNMYGIRLFLPFSPAWQRLDLTSVIDLWIWAVLLLGIAGPFVSRLVGGEISSGAARDRHHGRGGAIFALVFVLLYNSGRAVLHARAIATLESRTYQEKPAARVAALPDEVNPFHWKGLVETTDFFALADINLAGDFDPTLATILPKPDPDPAIDAARRTRTFTGFLAFAQYPLWRVLSVPEPEGAREVRVTDMRFRNFVARATVDRNQRVLSEDFDWNAGPAR